MSATLSIAGAQAQGRGPPSDQPQPSQPQQGTAGCSVMQVVQASGPTVVSQAPACVGSGQVQSWAQSATSAEWVAGASSTNTCAALLWQRAATDFVAVPCTPAAEAHPASTAVLDDACANLPLSTLSRLTLCSWSSSASVGPNYARIVQVLAGAPNLPAIPNPTIPNLQFITLLVASILADVGGANPCGTSAGASANSKICGVTVPSNPCGTSAAASSNTQVCGVTVPDVVGLIDQEVAALVADVNRLNPCGDVGSSSAQSSAATVCGVDVQGIVDNVVSEADAVIALILALNPCKDSLSSTNQADTTICGVTVPDVNHELQVVMAALDSIIAEIVALNPCKDVTGGTNSAAAASTTICGVPVPDANQLIAQALAEIAALEKEINDLNPCKDVTGGTMAAAATPGTICGVPVPNPNDYIALAEREVADLEKEINDLNPCKDVTGSMQAAAPAPPGSITLCGVTVPTNPCEVGSLPSTSFCEPPGGTCNGPSADGICVPICDYSGLQLLTNAGCDPQGGDPSECNGMDVDGACVPYCDDVPPNVDLKVCEPGGDPGDCHGPNLGAILPNSNICVPVCDSIPTTQYLDADGLCGGDGGGSGGQGCNGREESTPNVVGVAGVTVCVPYCDHVPSSIGPVETGHIAGCDGGDGGQTGPCNGISVNTANTKACVGYCDDVQGAPGCTSGGDSQDCNGLWAGAATPTPQPVGACIAYCDAALPDGADPCAPCNGPTAVDPPGKPICTDPCHYVGSAMIFGCPPPTNPCAYVQGLAPFINYPGNQPPPCSTNPCDYVNYLTPFVDSNVPLPSCPPSTDPCSYYNTYTQLVGAVSAVPLPPCPPPTDPCYYYHYADAQAPTIVPFDPDCPPSACYYYHYVAQTVPAGLVYYPGDQGGINAVDSSAVPGCIPTYEQLVCYYYGLAMSDVQGIKASSASSGAGGTAPAAAISPGGIDPIPSCIPDQCTTTLAPYWHTVFTNQPCKVPDICRDGPAIAMPFNSPCPYKPTDYPGCSIGICVTYTLNGVSKNVPLGVPAVFLANEHYTKETTAAAADAANCQYDIVQNVPVVHPCTAGPLGLVNTLPNNVVAVVELVGVPPTAGAFAGSLVAVPNPQFAGVFDASATVQGNTVGVQFGAQSTFAMLSGQFTTQGTAVDGDLLMVAPRSSGAAAAYVSIGGLGGTITQGSPGGGTGLPAAWLANVHYESIGGSNSVTMNWDSTVVAPLTIGAGGFSATIQDMPASVQGARFEVTDANGEGHYMVHWPGETDINSIFVNVGGQFIQFASPPTAFDVNLDITNQNTGADWQVIDFAMAGTRTGGSGKLDVIGNLAGTSFALLGLSDHLSLHFEREKDAATGVSLGSANAVPNFRLKVQDPTDATKSILDSATISIPGKAYFTVEGVTVVDIDSTLGANQGQKGYKVSFGNDGHVLVIVASGSGSGGIEFYGDSVTVQGSIALEDGGSTYSGTVDLGAEGSTDTVRLAQFKDGQPGLVITRLQSLQLDLSGEGDDTSGKEHVKADAVFGSGTLYLAMSGATIDMAGLNELQGEITLNMKDGQPPEVDPGQITLSWQIAEDGHIDVLSDQAKLTIAPGTAEKWKCSGTFPISCGPTTIYGDVATFSIKGFFASAICDGPNNKEVRVLDRAGDHDSFCLGHIDLTTIGAGAANGVVQSGVGNGANEVQVVQAELAQLGL